MPLIMSATAEIRNWHTVGYTDGNASRRSVEQLRRPAVRKLLCAAIVSLMTAGASVLAQEQVKKSKTSMSIDSGKDVTVTGCVVRSGDEFSLANAAGKKGALGSYVLVADGDERDELAKHVGHRVEIKGKAVDKGDGKLTMKTEREFKGSDGDKKKTESTTKVKGDLDGLPFLGVKSVRMLATVCP
jgi:hypothetical protein